MPVDPQCAEILRIAETNGSPLEGEDHLVMRKGYAVTTKVYNHSISGIKTVFEKTIKSSGEALKLRIYTPCNVTSKTPCGALIFFHGGGWALGDLNTHDHVCRYLSAQAGCKLISVDYRLAPEHKFPSGYDDCINAFRWTIDNAPKLNIDPMKIAVGGDSAGGNLAAAICIELRDSGGPKPVLQLLIYPALDSSKDSKSLKENGEGYLLTRSAIQQFLEWYLPSQRLRMDPRVSPQLAVHHTDLPKAWIQTAEFDPLRDEGEIYARTLAKHGVEVEYKCYAGMVHGFFRMGGRVDKAIVAMDDAVRALRSVLY